MTKLLLLCFGMLICAVAAHGQDFKVLEAKRAFKTDGSKIKQGDLLTPHDSVVVKEKGLLTLDINYPRNLTMEAGRYRLDTLFEELKYKYARHKRLVAMLEKRGLSECRFAYTVFRVPGSGSHYESGRIAILAHKVAPATRDDIQLSISWENPDKQYAGAYLVILQEGYGQELLIDVIETQGTTASVNVAKYKESFMQYTIQAEDCRSSLKRKIVQK